jgi:hypothetical protein
MYFSNCSAEITDSKITNNAIATSGGYGAGIYSTVSKVVLYEVEVRQNNNAQGSGGGAYFNNT